MKFNRAITPALATLAFASTLAHAQGQAQDEWRIGFGQVQTPYVNPQNASVAPGTNPLIEIGWTRPLSGPWTLRAGFIHAAKNDRQTQRTTTFLNGTTQNTDINIHTRANVFQVGLGFAFVEASWGQLTATAMLTHTRAKTGTDVTIHFQSDGQVTQQFADSWSTHPKMNRFAAGVEYLGPRLESFGAVSPYVSVQKFTANNGEGGKQTLLTAGLSKRF